MQQYKFHNRPDREIKEREEILDVLRRGKYATLGLCKDNEPYIVNLSYGYDSGSDSLYFHCARSGLKIDFIQSNPKVCATIIEDGGYILGECGHRFKTVVLWGEIEILTEERDKKYGMEILLRQLEQDENRIKKKLHSSQELYKNMFILRLKIMQINCKAGR